MRISNVTNTAVLEALHAVPGVNAVTNAHLRDVVGNKADTESYSKVDTDSLVSYIKGILHVIHVPTADMVNNIYIHQAVGSKADAAQTTVGTTRSIIAYAKGLLGVHGVPTVNAVTNAHLRDVVGNKADTASYARVDTDSLMSYVKGLIYIINASVADLTTGVFSRDVVGNKSDAAQTTVGTTRSIVGYVKGILNQTLKVIVKDPLEASSASATYVTLVDMTGIWRIYEMNISGTHANPVLVKLTLDGGTPVYVAATPAANEYLPELYVIQDATGEPGADTALAAGLSRAFVCEGKTSLKIEYRQTVGGTATVRLYYGTVS